MCAGERVRIFVDCIFGCVLKLPPRRSDLFDGQGRLSKAWDGRRRISGQLFVNKEFVMVNVQGDVVDFVFFRPDAQRVFLAGDFNDWREDELVMARAIDGHWTARMRLPAGEFKFRYCADGAWYTDYAAFGVEPGRFGLDSVVRVAPPALKVSTPSGEDAGVAAA